MTSSPFNDVTVLELIHCELSSLSEQVRIVLNSCIKYDAIELRGTIYYADDWNSELSTKFWDILSKSVTKIKIHEFEEIFATIDQEKYSCKRFLSQLTQLTEIECHWEYLKYFLSDDFLHENTKLQFVHTHFYFLHQTNVFMITDSYPHKGPNYGDFYISEEIVKILTYCKSLKAIGIPCHFVSFNIMNSLNEAAYVINSQFLGLSNVILVGNVYEHTVCRVTGIRIEIDKEMQVMTFNVNSLELGSIHDKRLQESVKSCHDDESESFIEYEAPVTCFFDHYPYVNNQVKNLTINFTSETCDECWSNFFRSFPNIRNIHSKAFLSASILKHVSGQLRHVKTLNFKYRGCLKDWNPMPSLQSLSIELHSKSVTLDIDNYISLSCPNLTSLSVKLGRKSALAVAYKEFVQNLEEKWKGITELRIDEMIRMNAQDLDAIEHCLKELKMLDIGCNECEQRILQSFHHLPKLELIIYHNPHGIRKVLTRNYFRQRMKLSSNETLINDPPSLELPIEIVAQIFSNLSYKDRLTCRIVCWKWRDILSSFIEFQQDRVLTLQNCVMDLFMEPMETFSQTTFNYEILRVGGNITIVGYKELFDFFKKICINVKEIQLIGKTNIYELVDIFENGLSVENLPKLERLFVEKSNIFGSLLQESSNMKRIVNERVSQLRFDSLKFGEIATWPEMSNITTLDMNVLYSFDNSFLCYKWPRLRKLTIGFTDGRFNGRLILFQTIPLLKEVSYLELGLLIIDTKIIDLIVTHCVKLKEICLSATNMKGQALEMHARMFFSQIETLERVSVGLTSIEDQRVRMKKIVTCKKSQVTSGEFEIDEDCSSSFFRREFDVKLLKLQDVNK